MIFITFLAVLSGILAEETPSDVSSLSRRSDNHLAACQLIRDEAQEIRSEAYTAIDKADTIREQAYRAKDEAFEMKEDAMGTRLALEQALVESLVLMKSQNAATSLYIQEMRSSLATVTTKLELLEREMQRVQGEVADVNSALGQSTTRLELINSAMEQSAEDIEDRIDEKTQEISDKLSKLDSLLVRKRESGELIPADRVEQSSTHPSTAYYGPENAVDGNVGTQTHTHVDGQPQWFKYFFSQEEQVGQIKIINGKISGPNIHRLNGLKVAVMASGTHKQTCQPERLVVREGESIPSQTYFISCNGNRGIGVEFLLPSGTYLEFREIEVYAS